MVQGIVVKTMNTHQLLKTSLASIMHHKGRSVLTTLGINIGVAAIIAMLAIGHGAEEKIKKEILSTGKNMIYVQSGTLKLFDQNKELNRKKSSPLTMDDLQALKKACPAIAKISPTTSGHQTIKYLNNTVSLELKSGNEDFLSILNRTIKTGSFITSTQVQMGSRVIVLGQKAAQELFKSLDPINQIVTINNIPFVVIGVVEKLKSQFGGEFYDANLDSFIPISTFKKYIERTRLSELRGIAISTKSYDLIPETVKHVTKNLRARHSLEIKDANDFTVFDQQSMLNAAKASANIFTFFLLIVACISLLVGGIGVMNIMMVSVGERTQEIGIRMALGAPDKLILSQFLAEALMLCTFGGLLGIVLGTATPFIASMFTGWTVVIKPLSIIVAFFAIFTVGLIFGYYPAYKASRLNPVDALQDQ